jgi:hypothetical protein
MRLDRLTLALAVGSLLLTWPTEALAQPAEPAQASPTPEPPQSPAPLPPEPTSKKLLPPVEFVSPGGDWRFGFHGMVGVSFYMQDTPNYVYNGQGILLASNVPANGFTTGADVRQTRFGFSLSGPKVLGATPKAIIDFDLFGLASPGAYGEVSVYDRIRLAYLEMKWKNTVLRFGQDDQIILGIVPDSIGHLAFPVTYTAGMIGWREPGMEFFQRIPFSDDVNLELALQIMKSDWESPYDLGAPTNSLTEVDLGQLSGWPGIEGRIQFSSPWFSAFVAGHYNHVEGTHQNDIVPPLNAPLEVTPNRNWDVVASVAGVKVRVGDPAALEFTAQGSGYYGKNLAPLLGELLTFWTSNDISEWGAWGQAKFGFLRYFDISGMVGKSKLNATDLETALSMNAGGGGNRYSNMVMGAMIRCQIAGLAFGPEYYHVIGEYIQPGGQGAPAGPGAPNGVLTTNQGMLSAMYFF